MLRAARRSGVDRAGDQVLAGAALAGDQHRQVVALHALDLIGDALHRGAGADEPRQQRLELPLERAGGGFERALARAAQRSNPWRRTAQSVRNRCSVGAASGRDVGQHRVPRRRPASRPIGSTSIDDARAPQRCAAAAAASARALSASQPAAPARGSARPASGRRGRRACASHASRSAVAPSRASSAGITAASTIRRTSASSPSIWTPT